MQFLSNIIEIIVNYALHIGYIGLAFIMFTNTSIGIPPSEVICIVFGAACAANYFSVEAVIIIATTSNLAGTGVLYEYAEHIVKKLKINRIIGVFRYLGYSEKQAEFINDLYDCYGRIIVLFGRNIPLIRSAISIPAGLKKLNRVTFYSFSAIGISIWVTIWTLLGFYLGRKQSEEYLYFIYGILMFSVFTIFSYLFARVKKKRNIRFNAK